METEYEVKILDIDVDDVKRKLKEIGAKKLCEREMRRYVYPIEGKGFHTWIRLRDNGERVTIALKEVHSATIDGTKELSLEVDDFDTAHLLLIKLGYEAKAYQENRRISYKMGNVKIEIDSWPMIPTYLEVEGENAEDVWKMVELLGFKRSQAISIRVKEVYDKYGIDLHGHKELKF